MRQHIITSLLFCASVCFSQIEGPVVSEKLEIPETSIKNCIQKRSHIWIDGQWKVENNNYEWVTGHWVKKRVGYHFVNGQWIEKNNGWLWIEGYWEIMPIKKWRTIYS